MLDEHALENKFSFDCGVILGWRLGMRVNSLKKISFFRSSFFLFWLQDSPGVNLHPLIPVCPGDLCVRTNPRLSYRSQSSLWILPERSFGFTGLSSQGSAESKHVELIFMHWGVIPD